MKHYELEYEVLSYVMFECKSSLYKQSKIISTMSLMLNILKIFYYVQLMEVDFFLENYVRKWGSNPNPLIN